MAILITGGAGFIGSHSLVEFLEAGYELVVVDNLVNSCEESMSRVKKITGKDFKFYNVDICDYEALEKVFMETDSPTALSPAKWIQLSILFSINTFSSPS